MQRRTISWFDYYFNHCLMTGWKGVNNSFNNWLDLLRGDYENYALLDEDCPYEECYNWFWFSLNDDCVYPKEFLEKLLTYIAAIDSDDDLCVDYPFSEWE